jgi:hypothetical protein
MQGWAPLHVASSLGHLQVVEYILELGIDVNDSGSVRDVTAVGCVGDANYSLPRCVRWAGQL